MGPLSTLRCSTAVKYWLSPPSCRTLVDLVTLCHLQPWYITVVITSVLCFTMPPCTLNGDLAESYRETTWEAVSKGESRSKFMLVTIKVQFNKMKSTATLAALWGYLDTAVLWAKCWHLLICTKYKVQLWMSLGLQDLHLVKKQSIDLMVALEEKSKDDSDLKSYMIHDYMCKDWLRDLQECCDCCSLGLQFRSEGHRCKAHQYLGFHCRHVFLTCCEGEESRAGNQDDWHSVRERPALSSTPPPKKGTVNIFLHTCIARSMPREGMLFGGVGTCNAHWCTFRKKYGFKPKTINFFILAVKKKHTKIPQTLLKYGVPHWPPRTMYNSPDHPCTVFLKDRVPVCLPGIALNPFSVNRFVVGSILALIWFGSHKVKNLASHFKFVLSRDLPCGHGWSGAFHLGVFFFYS